VNDASKPHAEIKKFWDDKALQLGDSPRATLGEMPLRRLEIRTMNSCLRRYAPASVLDVGCGNGYSTLQYAQRFPRIRFAGMDYSEPMIDAARKNCPSNCRFFVGDILRPDSYPEGSFDCILTQRCIQNLPDYAQQRQAIENLRAIKSPRGVILLMECSKDGVQQLNSTRKIFGRKPLEGIEPWHNQFLIDQNIVRDFDATIVYFSSTYMFLTKVIHPLFQHIATLIPAIGTFGYDRLYIII
jgi:ubiquinone/menaquinone biosynthesis C-methylase UbiE